MHAQFATVGMLRGEHYGNARHRRTRALWEGRYQSCLPATGRYLLTCCRYIELKPVRAVMVADLADGGDPL